MGTGLELGTGLMGFNILRRTVPTLLRDISPQGPVPGKVFSYSFPVPCTTPCSCSVNDPPHSRSLGVAKSSDYNFDTVVQSIFPHEFTA